MHSFRFAPLTSEHSPAIKVPNKKLPHHRSCWDSLFSVSVPPANEVPRFLTRASNPRPKSAILHLLELLAMCWRSAVLADLIMKDASLPFNGICNSLRACE